MNNLVDIKQDILNFWDLEEEAERNSLIEKVQIYADRQDADAFAKEVRDHFAQSEDSGIGVIYEALSERPEKWGRFFKEEYERAFKTAERSDHPFEILECLEEIYFVEEGDARYEDEIIKLLSTYLSNRNDVLRYKAVWLLDNLITEDNLHKYDHLISQLQQKLNDPNWKIRYIAKLGLESLDKLPPGYKMNFMDKVKAKFSSPYSIS